MDATLELVTEEKLDPKNHGLFLKAQSAIELLNYDYAISLLHGILKEEAGFLQGREILRMAQGARLRATGKKAKGLLSGGMLKVKGKVKKDPLAALQEIEKKRFLVWRRCVIFIPMRRRISTNLVIIT